jgi:glycerol uptake facilitator protein
LSIFGAEVIGTAILILLGATHSNHWRETEDPGLKLAVFCTAPAIRNTVADFITEVIGTFMLVSGVLAITADKATTGHRSRRAGRRRHHGRAPVRRVLSGVENQ